MRDILPSLAAEGHFRLTRFNMETHEHQLLVDKHNLIMNPATYITTRGLAGLPNSAVSHLYLAYNNGATGPSLPYTVTAANPDFLVGSGYGLLRIPLTFPATIISEPSNAWNLVTYNILVNQPTNYVVTGSASLGNTSDFFEAGLVVQTDSNGSPSNRGGDRVFARIAFERLAYNALFNLAVSWGIKLTI